LIFNIQNIY